MPIHRRRRIGFIRIVAATVLVVSGAACQGGNAEVKDTPSPTVASPTATPSPSATKDEKTLAGERALAAYRAWLELDWRAINAGDYSSRMEQRLRKVADGQALGHTRSSILSDEVNKIEWRGKPVYNPQVVSVDLTSKYPTVTIEDCADITNWEPFHKGTNKSARPASQKLRLPIIATVWRDRGRWLAHTAKADKDRESC